jgi:hypothetical protein
MIWRSLILFVYDLRNDAVSSSGYPIASNERMISEMYNHFEESSRGLTWSSVSQFTWKDWEKSRPTSVWTADLLAEYEHSVTPQIWSRSTAHSAATLRPLHVTSELYSTDRKEN